MNFHTGISSDYRIRESREVDEMDFKHEKTCLINVILTSS